MEINFQESSKEIKKKENYEPDNKRNRSNRRKTVEMIWTIQQWQNSRHCTGVDQRGHEKKGEASRKNCMDGVRRSMVSKDSTEEDSEDRELPDEL